MVKPTKLGRDKFPHSFCKLLFLSDTKDVNKYERFKLIIKRE